MNRANYYHEQFPGVTIRFLRNLFVDLIGWRWHYEIRNNIEGHCEEGAVVRTTFESRPWWDHPRVVESKFIDWRDTDRR